MILLSILIPTLPERSEQFETLKQYIKNQCTKEVEILHSDTAKDKTSIGSKRNMLYNAAKGKYSVQIDDDDWLPNYYVKEVLEAIKKSSDCIGYVEHCTIDGQEQKSLISKDVGEWSSSKTPIDGYHYRRTPFFKTPILTSICQRAGVKDLRYAEDHDFSKRIHPMLKTETFIDKVMYYYTANSLTPEQHRKRYGL